MSDLAKVIQNTSTAFINGSDQQLKNENLKLIDLETGIKFFKGRCIIDVANRLILRQKAYELLYDLYSKMEIVQKKEGGLWLSIYDALPETTTFVAKNDRGCIEGALTVIFDSPLGLPADAIYKKEIDEIRNSGRQICEFVSLGISKTVKKSIKVLACLFYCGFLHAWQKNKSRELVITVHSRFENFYRRNFFFNRIGPERKYSKVNGAPTVLLKISAEALNRLRRTHRVYLFDMIKIPDHKEFELMKKIENMVQPMSDEEFYTFFIEKTDAWENALPLQKDFIKGVYPIDEINHYEVSRALARGFSKKNSQPDHTLNDISSAI
jgi:hypothetical protein